MAAWKLQNQISETNCWSYVDYIYLLYYLWDLAVDWDLDQFTTFQNSTLNSREKILKASDCAPRKDTTITSIHLWQAGSDRRLIIAVTQYILCTGFDWQYLMPWDSEWTGFLSWIWSSRQLYLLLILWMNTSNYIVGDIGSFYSVGMRGAYCESHTTWREKLFCVSVVYWVWKHVKTWTQLNASKSNA